MTKRPVSREKEIYEEIRLRLIQDGQRRESGDRMRRFYAERDRARAATSQSVPRP